MNAGGNSEAVMFNMDGESLVTHQATSLIFSPVFEMLIMNSLGKPKNNY